MTKTQNLNLNILEGTDVPARGPLNENTQALEEAILADREAIAGKAESSQLSLSITALNSRIESANRANALVKLAGPHVTAGVGESGILALRNANPNDYSAMLMVYFATCSSGTQCGLKINSTTILSSIASTSGIGSIVLIAPTHTGIRASVLDGLSNSGTVNISWSNLSTVTFGPCYTVGSRAVLYGIKL